jgi:hypothetical protein
MWPGLPSLHASLCRLLRGHDGAEGVMLYRSAQQKFNASQVRPPLITIDCRVLRDDNVLLRFQRKLITIHLNARISVQHGER